MYTVLLLIDIYLPVKFLVDTSNISVLCSAQYICKFSETTGPTEAFHVTPPWERGKDGKLLQNDLGHLKSKRAPLFPGPEGMGDTNDWRITEPLNVQPL